MEIGMHTFGVEEEFAIVDSETFKTVPRSKAVYEQLVELSDRLDPGLIDRTRLEFHTSMIELVSSIHTSADELRVELTQNRILASQAAENVDTKLLAAGCAPFGGAMGVTDAPRYRQIHERFGALADTHAICGQHVHVGVSDKATAVKVCNYLRPWLPTIQALMTNSPYFSGRDTRYGSWRHCMSTRWPGWGPSPYMVDLDEYRSIVENMINAGVYIDERSSYWFARPSIKYPTIEIRVGDVALSADDAAFTAALVRALVATSVRDIGTGKPPMMVRDEMLEAAHWRAARYGLTSRLLDLRNNRLEDPSRNIGRMVEYCEEALQQYGDYPLVLEGLVQAARIGTGADKQRQAFKAGGFDSVMNLIQL